MQQQGAGRGRHGGNDYAQHNASGYPSGSSDNGGRNEEDAVALPTLPDALDVEPGAMETARSNRPAPKPASLEELCDTLSQECPWTQSIAPADMLVFLESECREVRAELEQCENMGMTVREHSTAELEAEFGDVFFDVLLLGKALERRFGACFSVERAKQRAMEKMSERCSYIWGNDVAYTAADCEAVFAKRKAEQKLRTAQGIHTFKVRTDRVAN